MAIENLKEKITEVELSTQFDLKFMRQQTSDPATSSSVQHLIEGSFKGYEDVVFEFLKTSAQKPNSDAEQIKVSHKDLGYTLSSYALKSLSNQSCETSFSEEAFNAYINLLNSKSTEYYIFDTLTTSCIQANIYNLERVQSILEKKNVSQGTTTYKYLIFPIIDISNKGSIQIIKADLERFTITVQR